MESWKVEKARKLAQEIEESKAAKLKATADLCGLAGMTNEWKEANEEQFDALVYEAKKRLGVED